MLKNERGAVLPFVLLTMLVTQLLFFSFLTIYENQMQTYILLKNHYQSQALLGLTERQLNEDASLSKITFNIGEVKIQRLGEKNYQITSQLENGYSETQVVDFHIEEKDEN